MLCWTRHKSPEFENFTYSGNFHSLEERLAYDLLIRAESLVELIANYQSQSTRTAVNWLEDYDRWRDERYA